MGEGPRHQDCCCEESDLLTWGVKGTEASMLLTAPTSKLSSPLLPTRSLRTKSGHEAFRI